MLRMHGDAPTLRLFFSIPPQLRAQEAPDTRHPSMREGLRTEIHSIFFCTWEISFGLGQLILFDFFLFLFQTTKLEPLAILSLGFRILRAVVCSLEPRAVSSVDLSL